MEFVLTKNINNISVDGYLDGSTPYFTRKQIGSALEYEFPEIAISKLHNRHKDRLDKFSALTKLTTPSGEQETFLYSTKGMLEICRWSRQPKADMVMDALYDMAEEVLKKGYFSLMSDEALATLLDEKINRDIATKKKIRESCQQRTILLDLDRKNLTHGEYVMQLRSIWGADTTGFNKAYDAYMKEPIMD